MGGGGMVHSGRALARCVCVGFNMCSWFLVHIYNYSGGEIRAVMMMAVRAIRVRVFSVDWLRCSFFGVSASFFGGLRVCVKHATTMRLTQCRRDDVLYILYTPYLCGTS